MCRRRYVSDKYMEPKYKCLCYMGLQREEWCIKKHCLNKYSNISIRAAGRVNIHLTNRRKIMQRRNLLADWLTETWEKFCPCSYNLNLSHSHTCTDILIGVILVREDQNIYFTIFLNLSPSIWFTHTLIGAEHMYGVCIFESFSK